MVNLEIGVGSRLMIVLALSVCGSFTVGAQEQKVAQEQRPAQEQQRAAKSFAETVRDLKKIEGFVPLYWDAEGGRMLMEIGRWNKEVLYQISLPTGVGSNPIGLDRGQLGDTHVVFF